MEYEDYLHQYKITDNDRIQITMTNVLERVDHTKYLGVILSENYIGVCISAQSNLK
jgi:hypothetical protein